MALCDSIHPFFLMPSCPPSAALRLRANDSASKKELTGARSLPTKNSPCPQKKTGAVEEGHFKSAGI
jgi:hypothetical protein